MTNEIKEIIKLGCEEEIEVKYFAKDDSLVNTYMDYSQLLDYITNLQDKLKWYENIDPNKTIDKFRLEQNMKVKNLQQRIDKAVEYCNNNIEFTPRLIDVIDILRGDE